MASSQKRSRKPPLSKNRSPGGGAQAAEYAVPEDARVSVLDALGDELYVLSYPVPQIRYPSGLTKAEKEIIQLLLDGLSTAQISRKRRTSPPTVSKQLASIYEKAGVKSRAELVAWMLGRS